jgi:phosphoketolase
MGQQHKVAHLYPITFENHQYSKKKQQDLVVVSYDSEGTTKVLYEPKTNYEIDRIEVMIDKSNHFISKAQCHDRQN